MGTKPNKMESPGKKLKEGARVAQTDVKAHRIMFD
jgi:hypothetical protein